MTAKRLWVRDRLPIREIVVAAAGAGWRHPGRIVIVAAVVSTAAALAELITHAVVDRANVPLALVGLLVAAGQTRSRPG